MSSKFCRPAISLLLRNDNECRVSAKSKSMKIFFIPKNFAKRPNLTIGDATGADVKSSSEVTDDGKGNGTVSESENPVNAFETESSSSNADFLQKSALDQEAGMDSDAESYADFMDLDGLSGITVMIQCPGVELVPVDLSGMKIVQEIHQVLMDHEDTCQRTCFSLLLDGVALNSFADIKTIGGLKDGVVLRMVEKSYSTRDSRFHVRHVRDLIKSMDADDAYNGIDGNSLTFLHTITQEDLLEKKKSRCDSVDCTPPECIMPGYKETQLLPLQPGVKNCKGSQAIKMLATSAWNPPPGSRVLKGDLLYLFVVTMEDKRYHITGCPKGFFINQSSDDNYEPKPDNRSHLCHSLIDLLMQVSTAFKRAFVQMQKKRMMHHAFERVPTPFQVYQWTAPQLEHSGDARREEDSFASKDGYEGHIPGQTRDWNEELQTTREMPRQTLPERLMRERAIFKIQCDFMVAAMRGAISVIDGNELAINAADESKMQMFIWNNIFFYMGFDVRDHYKDLGGDFAAFVAPRHDLNGVRAYSDVDVEGLFMLGTVVIDYRGYRITGQTIIPGFLERDHVKSVIYGSVDFGKTVLSHPYFLELLQKAGKHLKIMPHAVINEKDQKTELCSSVECKGIIGNDNRHYILDLMRTFPSDVNFLKLDDIELSAAMKEMGFPIEHKHKLCCLRQELLDAFVVEQQQQQLNATDSKQEADIASEVVASKADPAENVLDVTKDQRSKEAKEETKAELKLEAQQKKSSTDSNIKETQINVTTADETPTNEVAVDSEFDIRFNPDVFSPGIRHFIVQDGPNSNDKQKKVVQDAAEFLVTHQIPAFINDQISHSAPIMDGSSLTEALHSYGINMRYLGKLATLLAQVPTLDYLHRIVVMELLVRAAKHYYYTYIQNTEAMNVAAAISHFLNCFLTSGPLNTYTSNADDAHKPFKRGKNKNKNCNRNVIVGGANGAWAAITPKTLWHQLKKEIKSYWHYKLKCDSIESAVATYGVQRISTLRALCLKVGIQILLREYNFESRNKATFNDDDILHVFPIVKNISTRATDAYNFSTMGQVKIQQGLFKEGYDLISRALNLFNNVYGTMHTENGFCLRLLAQLSYLLGDTHEALAIQERAVIMSERVNGIDHPNTVLGYTQLALYSFAKGYVSTSLKLLYRAKYLLLLICGEDHPFVGLIDSNIGLILHALCEYDLSIRFLGHALEVNLKYFGNKSMRTALTYHLLARSQSCVGDFRSALNSEKESYIIYKTELGATHEKTQESADNLRWLTQQAVTMQRKMNDYSRAGMTPKLPSTTIPAPAMGAIVDMLNMMNDIFFVQINQKDLTKVRAELLNSSDESFESVETFLERGAGDAGVFNTKKDIDTNN